MNDNTAVIITAGGSSSRFGGGNKLLADIDGKPLFLYSLKKFAELVPPDRIALVVPAAESANFADAIANFAEIPPPAIVNGGESRMHSVCNGLRFLLDKGILPNTLVAVHDAARPLADATLLEECFIAARKHGSAVSARPLTDTIKEIDGKCRVRRTLDRSMLWTVETPQVFPLQELFKAYQRAFENEIFHTDDAGVMEAAGHHPFLLENRRPNIKITIPEDLDLIRKIFAGMNQ